MINKLKQRLEEVGYRYKVISDFEIKITFCDYMLVINETLSDKFHIRKVNWNNDTLETKVYKTVNGVVKYIKES